MLTRLVMFCLVVDVTKMFKPEKIKTIDHFSQPLKNLNRFIFKLNIRTNCFILAMFNCRLVLFIENSKRVCSTMINSKYKYITIYLKLYE